MTGILVLGASTGGSLEPMTGELLAAARSLGEGVSLALPGNSLDAASGEAIELGADRVMQVEHPLLAEPSTEALVAAFEQVCLQTSPAVVIVGKTPAGHEVGPRLAFRLGVGLAQDCVEVRLDRDSGRVVAIRPVYGGNALATVTFADVDPQFVAIRGAAYEPLERDRTRTGEVVRFDVDLDPSVVKVRHIETVSSESEGIRLEDASVVVSGGRGLGGAAPFEMLEELAALLGGAVGASRAACDAGWVDHNYQVGLTGKTVTPSLYITVGISGASQHMAGCSGARHIVAVNRDPDANIFKEATYGVVGSWENVLSSFIETVRELVKS